MERVTFAASVAAEGRTLSGIAHAFGQRTRVGGRLIEFDPHAFDSALARSDVRAFINHDPNLLLGRQSNGTVRVQATPAGLAYSIDVPDTTYGNDLLEMVRRGDLHDMSFGITPGKYTLSKASDGTQVQTHTSVNEIFDVSPVSLPAFSGTSVSLHSQAPAGDPVKSQLILARHNRARKTT